MASNSRSNYINLGTTVTLKCYNMQKSTQIYVEPDEFTVDIEKNGILIDTWVVDTDSEIQRVYDGEDFESYIIYVDTGTVFTTACTGVIKPKAVYYGSPDVSIVGKVTLTIT